MTDESGVAPLQAAEADVANAQYIRTLVTGLSWLDLDELIAYARLLHIRKAA